jgi:hypothetical protein
MGDIGGYAYAELFVGVFLVILVFLISRAFKTPFYIDPYGERSIRLTNRLPLISRVVSLFLFYITFGKYKLLTSTSWRANKIIEEALKSKETGIIESLEAKFIAGETGKGMRESIHLALKEGYKVTLLTGRPYCDAVGDIKEFIKKYPKFELYINLTRPEKHFGIIANKHVFLEVSHTAFQKKKDSLGINRDN